MHKEETLRQKSWVVWLKVGDENSRYFHNYANKRRPTNYVLESIDVEGNMAYDQGSIKKVARIHFANLFKDPNNSNICDQLDIIKLFPSVFTEADCLDLVE